MVGGIGGGPGGVGFDVGTAATTGGFDHIYISSGGGYDQTAYPTVPAPGEEEAGIALVDIDLSVTGGNQANFFSSSSSSSSSLFVGGSSHSSNRSSGNGNGASSLAASALLVLAALALL